MKNLTKTPIWPNCQMFFCITVNYIIQELNFCLSFSGWGKFERIQRKCKPYIPGLSFNKINISWLLSQLDSCDSESESDKWVKFIEKSNPRWRRGWNWTHFRVKRSHRSKKIKRISTIRKFEKGRKIFYSVTTFWCVSNVLQWCRKV